MGLLEEYVTVVGFGVSKVMLSLPEGKDISF